MTTESLFYPVALAFALVLVRYLERPGWQWLAGARRRARGRVRDAVAVARLRAGDRDGAAPPGAACAVALRRRSARSSRSTCSARPPRSGSSCVQAARGQSLADLLGAYSIVGEGGYDAGHVLRFWLWHVEELDLYVGIVPVRGAPARAAGRPHPPRPAAGARRGDDGVLVAWSTLAVGDVRVAVRVGPHPGSLPVLPRSAPRRRRARLGRARRPTASCRDRDRRRGDRAGARRSSSRTSGSSASRRSRTRSG